MEEVKILTKDGIKIAINHYKNSFDSVVIIAPGWFMTKDSKSFKKMSEILSKKFDVVAMDFRGHGNSTGFYTFTRKEINDLNAVVNFSKENYKKIYLMGFSLGGALVLDYASKNEEINKVIAISAPTCFEKIENKMWKKEAWLPTFQKCELKRWLSIRPSLMFGKTVKPIEIIKNVKCPTLFIAGEKDPTVCEWHTKKLYEDAICKKKYVLFENCAHAEDLFIQEQEKFIEICTEWLENE